ncbi:MAG: transposase [Candidatus Nealsonbacteria bacterium]
MKFEVGSFAHIYNRGNRKQPIVRDAKDKWHFLQVLYYLNHKSSILNPFRELRELLKSDFNNQLIWPARLGLRSPLIKILAFKLRENHLHLLLKQEVENGIQIFMQRAGIAIAKRFNERYREVGSLFQGRYKGKLIEKDNYLTYLSVYIQVKNAFEEYPGGLEKAVQEFDKAFEWAIKDPYNSLGDYAGNRNSPIIDRDVLGEMFPTPQSYKEFAKQCLFGMNLDEKLGKLRLD